MPRFLYRSNDIIRTTRSYGVIRIAGPRLTVKIEYGQGIDGNKKNNTELVSINCLVDRKKCRLNNPEFSAIDPGRNRETLQQD
jgi:hypothetical protein